MVGNKTLCEAQWTTHPLLASSKYNLVTLTTFPSQVVLVISLLLDIACHYSLVISLYYSLFCITLDAGDGIWDDIFSTHPEQYFGLRDASLILSPNWLTISPNTYLQTCGL